MSRDLIVLWKRKCGAITENKTNKWTDILDDLIDSYNNSYHRSIKIEPNKVSPENENQIYENLYGFKKNEGDSTFLKKFKFSIGDFVRLSKIKKKPSKKDIQETLL